jgi:hypothetical protein
MVDGRDQADRARDGEEHGNGCDEVSGKRFEHAASSSQASCLTAGGARALNSAEVPDGCRISGVNGRMCRTSGRPGRAQSVLQLLAPMTQLMVSWLISAIVVSLPYAFACSANGGVGVEGGSHMRGSSVAAVWLFMLLVGTSGPVQAQQTGRGNPPLVPDTMYGPDLFKFYCAPCHGRDGKGHGPVASVLKTSPSDLTQIAKRNGGVFPADRVEVLVTNGLGADPLQAHGTPEMPVWGPVFRSLDPSDARVRVRIANLIAYLDAIQAK